MAYKPKVKTVPEGCSGVGSFVPYAPILAGSTSTGNMQSSATIGNSGDIYTSNGAGAALSFQAPAASSAGYLLFLQSDITTPMPDSTTSYLANGFSMQNNTVSSNQSKYFIPKAATLKAVYGFTVVNGVLASGESSSLTIRLNNSTNTLVSSSILFSSASNTFSNNALSLSLIAGDFIEFTFTTPAWVTNPTFVSISFTALLS